MNALWALRRNSDFIFHHLFWHSPPNLYDPYDLSKGIKIYYDGKQYPDAVPAKIHRHSKKGFERELLVAKPSSGINFLEQLAEAELPRKQAISFSGLREDDEL